MWHHKCQFELDRLQFGFTGRVMSHIDLDHLYNHFCIRFSLLCHGSESIFYFLKSQLLIVEAWILDFLIEEGY